MFESERRLAPGPEDEADQKSPMWIFGYGSIIWKPGFEYVERRPGYVEGWVRRFHQYSTEHRGEPEAPGRVVTVVQGTQQRCWGMAYRIRAEVREEIVEQLDHRERGGYERHEVDVITPRHEGRVDSAIMYVAPRENPNWAGAAPIDALAKQIVTAAGLSGDNVEYVLELAEALREIGAVDAHVYELEREVLRRLRE